MERRRGNGATRTFAAGPETPKAAPRPTPEPQTMRSNGAHSATLTTLAAVLLWTAPCTQAAPMECHFDSRAQCVFQGANYTMGESWMDDACNQCTCLHPMGVGCCETVQRPVDFPSGCEVRVEAVTCKVSLVQTADPRLPCFPGGNELLDPSHGSLKLGE